MKKSIAAITIALIALSFSVNNVIPIGGEMPKKDVKMKDISGNDISMKEAADKNGLLVIFVSNACPYVVKNEKRITDITNYAKRNNFGVILLNSNEAYRDGEDSYTEMKHFASRNNLKCYYVIDTNSEIADAFEAKRTPECFLFDNKLNLTYHGAIDDNPSDESAVKRQHLREAITEMANGNAVSVTESKSVGCQIKRKQQ